MELEFYKYQGTGNDFIIIDNRNCKIIREEANIARLCDRHFGIGADGLMLLQNVAGHHFEMVYFNADGRESTMCGNGGRCIVAFARRLGIIQERADFLATDGAHTAYFNPDNTISLQMSAVTDIRHYDNYTILNTGSPHYVLWKGDVMACNVVGEGRVIRNQPEFQPDGINVNFVQHTPTGLKVRTYERGVEDETLSCGTGVTAAAIAATGDAIGRFHTEIETMGGSLNVSYNKIAPNVASEVILTGEATFVFRGVIGI